MTERQGQGRWGLKRESGLRCECSRECPRGIQKAGWLGLLEAVGDSQRSYSHSAVEGCSRRGLWRV